MDDVDCHCIILFLLRFGSFGSFPLTHTADSIKFSLAPYCKFCTSCSLLIGSQFITALSSSTTLYASLRLTKLMLATLLSIFMYPLMVGSMM